MGRTFTETVDQARAGIDHLTPSQLQARLSTDPSVLVLDVRDAKDLHITGVIAGSENVSMGNLFYAADHEMPGEYRAACLADKNRPIVTTCTFGMVAAIAARTLQDYGYTKVSVLEGGNAAWKEAGLPLEPAPT